MITVSIANTDLNYKEITSDSTLITIQKISGTLSVPPPSDTPQSKFPYPVTLIPTLTRTDAQKTVPFKNPNMTVKTSSTNADCSDVTTTNSCTQNQSLNDNSFTCLSNININDYKNSSINLCVTFTDENGYYQTKTSNISVTLQPVQCNINNQPFKYKDMCDPSNACKLSFGCNNWSSNDAIQGISFDITRLNPTQDAKIKLPNQIKAPIYNKSKFDCSMDTGGIITCSNFAPISDTMLIVGDLQINATKFADITNFRLSVATTQGPTTTCGHLTATGADPQYTATQQMFDCYARVQNAIGYGDGSGKVITPGQPEFNMQKSWYLFACPNTTDPTNQCSWLSPEIPSDTQMTNQLTTPPPSDWQDRHRPATAFIPDITKNLTSNGAPTSLLAPTLMKDLIGKRILWSGSLEHRPNLNFNFFYTNGFSPRPVAKLPYTEHSNGSTDPQATGYPDLLSLDPNEKNYGAYTGFLTLTHPSCDYVNWDGQPWNLRCWLVFSPFNWASRTFPTNWHDLGTDRSYLNAAKNTICAGKHRDKETIPTKFQWCMGLIAENEKTSPSDVWVSARDAFYKKANAGQKPEDRANLAKYAYVDVCRRRSTSDETNAESFDPALIRRDQYSWQVPSYPMLLTLTGKSQSDGGDQTCANQSAKDEWITRCLVSQITKIDDRTQWQIAGFYAANKQIPGFQVDAYLWSSDIVMDNFSSRGGYCEGVPCQWSAFAFKDGYVTNPRMDLNDQSADVRCISLDW